MLELNYRDARPIDEQIRESIRKLIVTGSLDAEVRLPSIKEMAAKLAINPNTIARAYRYLEEEGYICSSGEGAFFAAPQAQVQEYRIRELLAEFDEITSELLFLAIPSEELAARVSRMERKA